MSRVPTCSGASIGAGITSKSFTGFSSTLGACMTEGGGLKGEIRRKIVIDLKYSLVIEATKDPMFFGFYSPDLEGFTGIGHSVEDCLYQAKWGMEEHVGLLKEQSIPIPKENPDPKIIIQNQESLARAS